MTNERAIELLHRISDSQFDGEYGDERREALEMAVRALEGDGDTISRQAAMVVFENSGLDDDSKDTAVRVLEQLPPAQPERKTGQLLYHHTEDIDEERTADVYFCSSCKGEVLKKIRFGFCGGELDIQYGFCPICGARLSGENDD